MEEVRITGLSNRAFQVKPFLVISLVSCSDADEQYITVSIQYITNSVEHIKQYMYSYTAWIVHVGRPINFKCSSLPSPVCQAARERQDSTRAR